MPRLAHLPSFLTLFKTGSKVSICKFSSFSGQTFSFFCQKNAKIYHNLSLEKICASICGQFFIRRQKLSYFRSKNFPPTFRAEQEMFYCPTLYLIHTPAPKKVLFLDLRPDKRHVGWKNNSKHFLLRCCYTNFRPFARKSRLCTLVVGRKIVICGQMNKNE